MVGVAVIPSGCVTVMLPSNLLLHQAGTSAHQYGQSSLAPSEGSQWLRDSRDRQIYGQCERAVLRVTGAPAEYVQ